MQKDETRDVRLPTAALRGITQGKREKRRKRTPPRDYARVNGNAREGLGTTKPNGGRNRIATLSRTPANTQAVLAPQRTDKGRTRDGISRAQGTYDSKTMSPRL